MTRESIKCFIEDRRSTERLRKRDKLLTGKGGRCIIYAEVGSASFFGGALSAGPLQFFLCPLALVRCDFKFASALRAIPL
jgi:hypothetical protein